MINFGLIGALKDYATANNMVFLYGESFMQNYEASQQEYINGQQVLTAEFSCQPRYGTGAAIIDITYNGVLALGMKFDDDGTANQNDGTAASLDETKIQKYERRLLLLMIALSEVIRDISCANELTIGSVNMRMDINKFDTNIDFVVSEITFVQ